MRPLLIVRQFVFSVGFIVMISSFSQAASGITYHGKILRPDGVTPISSANTQFRIQVRTPGAENCLLWEEQQTKDLSSSNGIFTITINDTTEPSLIANVLPYSIERVFSNRTNFTGLTNCSSGTIYNPSSAVDGRNLQVYFREVPTDPWEQMPVTKVNFVPLALNSVQLEGYAANEFLKIDPLSAYTPLTAANVNTLVDIIAGTNAQYLKPSSSFSGDVTGTSSTTVVEKIRGTNVVATAPTLNQVLKFDGTNWVPSADDTGAAPVDASYTVKGVVQINTDLATSGLFIAGGVLAMPNVITAGGPTGNAQTVPVITYDQKGRLTAVSTATIDDTTKLPLAGGTMTGPINMGTQAITNASSVSANDFSGRNIYHYNLTNTQYANIKAPDALALNYTLTLPTTAPVNGYVLSTDASGNLSWLAPSAGSVTNVTGTAPIVSSGGATPAISLNTGNGLTVSSNNLVVDTGLSANKIPQVGGTALGANGVVVANGTGTALTSLNCAVGEVIKYDASGFATCGTDTAGTGTVTSVSSANTDIGVSMASPTPVLTLNSGTGADQIVKLTAAAKYPAVDGSLITNLDAANISAGTLPIARGGTNSSTALNNNRLMVSSGGSIVESSAMSDGQILVGKNASAPQVVTLSGDATVSNTGAITVSGLSGKPFNGTFAASNKIAYYNNTSGNMEIVNFPTCGVSEYLTFDGSAWSCVADAGAAGTVSSVSVTNPITNSGTGTAPNLGLAIDPAQLDLNGSNQLHLKASGITNTEISATAAIARTKLASGTADHVLINDGSGVMSSEAHLAVTRGGTGQSTYSDGELLIGNSTGNTLTKATLTQGSGISITNGNGSISIASTLGTSVDLTSEVNGTLPVANGGTGQTSWGNNSVIVSNGTGTALSSLNCTVGQVIKYDASGFAGCGSDSGVSGNEFVNGGNSFSGTATLGTNDNNNLEIETNGTTKMTVLADGKVGIGTTSPRQLLHVGAGTDNPMGASYDALYVTNNGNTGIGVRDSSADVEIELTAWGGKGWLGTKTNQSLNFFTNDSSERMTISTAGNVGIGTTSPTSALQVVSAGTGMVSSLKVGANPGGSGGGGIYYNQIVLDNTYGAGNFKNQLSLQSAGVEKWSLGNDISSLGQQNFYIWDESAGATRFFINSTGNVGIGTTSPGYKLDVAGDVNITGNFRINGTPIGGGSGTVTSVSSANTDIGVSMASPTPVLTLNSGTGADQIVKLTAAAKYPAVDGSLITNLDAANISAGTLSVARGGTGLTSGTSGGIPYFDSASTMASSGVLASNGVMLGGGAGASPTTTAAGTADQVLRIPGAGGAPAFGAIDLTKSAAVTGALGVANGGTGATSLAANNVMVTNGTGSALTAFTCTLNQVLSFDASGYAVCANVSALSASFQNGGNSFSATANLGTNDNYDLNFKTNNTTKMTILANGNVGIGTTAPNALMHGVGGNIMLDGGNGGCGQGAGHGCMFTLDPLNGGGPRLSLGSYASPSAYFELGAWSSINNFDSKSRDLKLYNAGGSIYLQNSSGNVGIGATAPKSILHLDDQSGSGTPTTLQITNLATTNSSSVKGLTIGLWGNQKTAEIAQRENAPLYVSTGSGGSGDIIFAPSGTNRVAIDSAGKVGIGTTSPSYLLNVVGSASDAANIRIETPIASTWAGVQMRNGTLNYSTNIGTDNNFHISSGTIGLETQLLTVNSVGNVGIGTASPAAALHLAGNKSSGAWTTNGIALRSDAATYTDTTSSGTVASNYVNAIGIPTLAASNATTYTTSATMYIAGAPTSGTNVTPGTAYAFYVGSGLSILNGGLSASTNLGAGNFYVAGGNVNSQTTSASHLIGGAATLSYRGLMAGSTAGMLPTNSSFANMSFGAGTLTESTSGNHPLITNVSIKPVVITGAAATVTNTASLYIEDAATATVTGGNYSLYSAAGTNYFGGNVGIGNAAPSKLLHVGSSSVGTGLAVANFQNVDGTCTITPASSGSGIACSSDERLKENFQNVTGEFALERILQLQAVTYNFKTSSADNRRTGYKAQEVQKVAPEFVRENDDGLLQVYYDAFIPWITEAIKTLYTDLREIKTESVMQARQIANVEVTKADKTDVDQLKMDNAAKDKKIKELEERLEKIEKALNSK